MKWRESMAGVALRSCSAFNAFANSGMVIYGSASMRDPSQSETLSSLLRRGRPCGDALTPPVRLLRCMIRTALAAEIRKRRATS
jgi:hypothetical protein